MALVGFAAAFAAFFLVARLHCVPVWVSDLGIGLATAGLCAQRRVIRWRGAASFQERMAGFSFSLYVTHFPVALFALAILQHHGQVTARLHPSAAALAIFCAVVAAAYACAWLFSQITEARTHRFRQLLLAVLTPREKVTPV